MTSLRALVLPVGGELYAVDADRASEVVARPSPTRLPLAPPEVAGLINLRGEIVPLFDTAAVLGVGQLASWAFAAVVRTNAGPAGLATSALPTVTELGEAVAASELTGTIGTFAIGRRLVVLVDVDALPARLGALAGAEGATAAAVPVLAVAGTEH